MAGLAAILGALGRSFGRDLRSTWSLRGNNFFIVSVVLLQGAGAFIYVVIGLVMLFPLSTDPLRKIPASRMALWPLNRPYRLILRTVSPWVNPMTWLIAVLAIWAVRGSVKTGLWVLFAALVAAGFAISALPKSRNHSLWRRVPRFPSSLNQLVRKNLREIVCTLDLYCALLLSLSAFGYRLAMPPLPEEALTAITGLVVLALSGHAQSSFGLDGAAGLTRYRLLPLSGWQVLAAKDVAYVLAIVVLTLPLAPLSGLGAAMAALAVGHGSAVKLPGGQVRWRFSIGAPFFPEGLVQSAAILGAVGAVSHDKLFLAACIAVCAASLWKYGRVLDRTLEGE